MIKDLFSGFDPDYLLVMDGYDDCIVGVVERFGQEPIVNLSSVMTKIR
jgi:hypothetical protein